MLRFIYFLPTHCTRALPRFLMIIQSPTRGNVNLVHCTRRKKIAGGPSDRSMVNASQIGSTALIHAWLGSVAPAYWRLSKRVCEKIYVGLP